jgi:hypothetical protein
VRSKQYLLQSNGLLMHFKAGSTARLCEAKAQAAAAAGTVEEMGKCVVLGCGQWGSALALLLYQ